LQIKDGLYECANDRVTIGIEIKKVTDDSLKKMNLYQIKGTDIEVKDAIRNIMINIGL
jgi:hypothetical protein